MAADNSASPGGDLNSLSPQIEALLDKVLSFVNAPNWNESRSILENNSDLLTNEALGALSVLIDLYGQKGEREVVSTLRLHQDLLALCREVGIDEAFKRLRESGGRLNNLSEPKLWFIIRSLY
jgi:hypothetical protein